MANKMLVDAAHPEETRVVVLRGNRVEEFDFESASRKQLRGNIYLAKVTRVEPSLQAAFVDYGGNRHGFLAFSEIHPDYYQIPVADRQALIEAEEREIAEAEDRADEAAEASEAGGETAVSAAARADDVDAVASEAPAPEGAEDGGATREPEGDAESAPEAQAESAGHESPRDQETDKRSEESGSEDGAQAGGLEVVSDDRVESVGAEDALEELPERRKGRPRQYKIQEVIKRRQVLLVQVVKEERGTKGAALTTYLSLAGRYSVLMPNTARGGGISRKITSPADRKRLKEVASELDVPEGMGIILRTAGASRTKAEVKRDFEYLLRLWENVRELTLRSTAPTLVYEEGSLIKRSIRDLYNKDIDEIQVAGEEAYREAKDFMRMLMPSHAKNVQPYRDKQPIFQKNGIEAQLDAMFSPQVTLRSGGYLVINQTEALVSIDVNSGRATREHNIEDTAYQTNLEASEEVARQLRLRDLAGLIVIDFIDMEEKRNNRSVERKLKDALKHDRARIQVGRISHFGLLEMSRQRIRTGVLESTTTLCPVCQGTGHVRAPASVALHVLRSLEDSLLRGVTHNLIVHARTAVALYILNQKRPHLSELEQRFGLTITVMADETISNGSHFSIERGEAVERREVLPTSVQPDSVQPIAEEEEEPVLETEAEEELPAREGDDRGEEAGGRRRRRRRRRRGGEGFAQPGAVAARDDTEEGAEGGEADEAAPEEPREHAVAGESDGDANRKRRRGRRGGRRGRRGRGEDRGSERMPMVNGGEPFAAERSEAPAYAEPGEAPTYVEPYRATNGGGEQDYASGLSMQASDAGLPDRSSEESGGYPVAVPTAPDHESPAEHHPEPREYPPVAVPLTPDAPSSHEHQGAENVEATMRRPEPKEIVREEPAPAEEPRPPQAEEPGRPKRSGWWQRRTFF